MTEKLLQNKKNGMPILLAILAGYVVAILVVLWAAGAFGEAAVPENLLPDKAPRYHHIQSLRTGAASTGKTGNLHCPAPPGGSGNSCEDPLSGMRCPPGCRYHISP